MPKASAFSPATSKQAWATALGCLSRDPSSRKMWHSHDKLCVTPLPSNTDDLGMMSKMRTRSGLGVARANVTRSTHSPLL